MSGGRRSPGARREAREQLYRETSARYRSLLDSEVEESDEPVANEEPDKRHVDPEELGWRTSRRTSRLGKVARRTQRRDRRIRATKEAASEVAVAGGRVAWSVTRVLLTVGGGLIGLVLLLIVVASAINGIARWDARRRAADQPTPQELAQDNLLIIGADDGVVTGFLAIRVEEGENQIFGIAIPDAAFMEVPGQGFERAGDSFKAGPEVSAAAISNFLSVLFEQWVVVDVATYQEAMQSQSLRGVLDEVGETNLSEDDLARFARAIDGIPDAEVALVPLPVKPISLGEETYFEPQREEVADLMLSWWDVNMTSDKDMIRVIVYNGSGDPGIAGVAAQELIRQGFRVVETRNAESFDYEQTLVVIYHGEDVDAEAVRDALGVGEIVREEASQEVADIIVIIGADFAPSSEDG